MIIPVILLYDIRCLPNRTGHWQQDVHRFDSITLHIQKLLSFYKTYEHSAELLYVQKIGWTLKGLNNIAFGQERTYENRNARSARGCYGIPTTPPDQLKN